MRFKFIHLEQTAFSNVSGNLHIKWRGKAISYANVCMIPYFVIGGPYVAGWGCAGEESRRSCNMFDKHRGTQGQNTHVHMDTHTQTLWEAIHLCSVSISFCLPPSHSLPLTFSWCLPLSVFIFLPQDPLEGTTFHPRTDTAH